MANPLSEQCTAKSKRSGERCRRLVVGGGVCHTHGGAARQVKARREQRVLLAEAQAAAQTVIVQREPEEILLDALHDTNATLQAIKAELHAGLVNPILLRLAGEWLDRVARIARVVVDGDVSRKLNDRIGWSARDRANQLWGLLCATLKAAEVSAQDRLLLWNSVEVAVRLVVAEREPLRVGPEEVRLFGDELEMAAAVERAAAEGVSWGDPEPDADSDRVPFLFPVDGSGDGLVS